MDVAEIFFFGVKKPCVRWPPWGRSRPMMRSCGLSSAVYTAKFAGEPDKTCTFTPHSSDGRRNAASARSWHSLSVSSMNSLPP
eukprot:31365-Pelagococcus_subviridis.AAC.3